MIRRDRSKEQDRREKELIAKYYKTINQEETHWRQKARVNWIQKGDRNIKFFKMTTLRRRSFNKIVKTKKSNGITTYEEDEIQEEFVSYFENLLNSTEQPSNNVSKKLLDVIPNLVNQEQNKFLEKEVT